MFENTIKSKTGNSFLFRELEKNDHKLLAVFFEGLGAETRSRYGPHALTDEHAKKICDEIPDVNCRRFIVLNENQIVGYFILDFSEFSGESKRYKEKGIELDFKQDPLFAPCIHDDMQNQGIASAAMVEIVRVAKELKLRNIVLMGGTQETNDIARAFYKKFGFKEYATFYTSHNQLNNIDMMLTL